MLALPGSPRQRIITNAGTLGTSPPWQNVPSHASSAGVDGAVTELISAANNNQESWGIEVAVTNTGASGVASQSSVKILIGGATDDILIPPLLCGYAVSPQSAYRYLFPVYVPSGVRIAAVLNSVRTGINASVGVWLYGGAAPPWRVGRKVVTCGSQSNGNSRGQAVTVAASGGTATVNEMTASTPEDFFAFLPAFQSETDSSLQGRWYNIGIAVGAAPEDRIGTWWFQDDAGESAAGPIPHFPAFCDVPAGSRLSLLASNNSTSSNTAYGGLIYAVN